MEAGVHIVAAASHIESGLRRRSARLVHIVGWAVYMAGSHPQARGRHESIIASPVYIVSTGRTDWGTAVYIDADEIYMPGGRKYIDATKIYMERYP